MSGLINIKTVNLTLNTKNAAEGQNRLPTIVGKRLVINAIKTSTYIRGN